MASSQYFRFIDLIQLHILRVVFFLVAFFMGFIFSSYFVLRSVESSHFVDCGNGYMVRPPLACPSEGLTVSPSPLTEKP
jgi:hypothetical protein